jgi:LPS-assembly protein
VRESYLNASRYWTSWSFNGTLRYYDNLATDNTTTLQYLPELSLDALRQEIMETGAYFKMNSTYVYYYRDEGSTGHVADIQPKVSYPINLGTYLEVEPSFTMKERLYAVENSDDDESLTESGTSELWTFNLEAETYLYKVYQFGGEDGFVMKHGIEPYAEYTFTPAMDESDVNSLAARTRSRTNMVSYGVRNTFTSKTPLQDGPDGEKLYQYREFLRIKLTHSYDIEEARRDENYTEVTDPITGETRLVATDREPWGNFYALVELQPTNRIYMEADATYNPYTEDFTAYNALMRLSDERGDAIMLDYRFLKDSVNWLSAELRLAVTSEWAVSYINSTDFDDNSRTFENTLQVSYTGQCWGVRALFTETVDDQGFFLIFSLKGLGEVLGMGG